MRSLEARAREFFLQFPQILRVSKNRGPGFKVNGSMILTTEYFQKKTLSDNEKAWLIEMNMNEAEFRRLQKALREFLSLDKNIDLDRATICGQ